jgi:predicted amidophosphoribosyltransferase
MRCSECGSEVPNNAWSCPHCGKPAEERAGAQAGKEISTKGMVLLLLLFVAFPVLLFLIHIFVPNM